MSQATLKPGVVHKEALRIAGEKVHRDRTIDIAYPYTGEVIATVPKATLEDVRLAYRIARDYKPTLTRYERYKILMRAGEIIASRLDEISRVITLESGLSRKEAAERFELPADRIGDIVVVSEQSTVIGTSASRHDLSALEVPLRSHGGTSEQQVPLIANRRSVPLPPGRRWRNFDAFDLCLNLLQ